MFPSLQLYLQMIFLVVRLCRLGHYFFDCYKQWFCSWVCHNIINISANDNFVIINNKELESPNKIFKACMYSNLVLLLIEQTSVLDTFNHTGADFPLFLGNFRADLNNDENVG